MSRTGATPVLPGLEVDHVARLRGRLAEGADIFGALGGGEAAWAACRERGVALRKLDAVVEHVEVLAHAKETTGLVATGYRREAA